MVPAQSVHTSSPSFVGHMTSALPYFMIPLSKIMIALNQNLVKTETSKAFTPLERQVLGMLHRLTYGESTEFYDTWLHHGRKRLGAFGERAGVRGELGHAGAGAKRRIKAPSPINAIQASVNVNKPADSWSQFPVAASAP